MTAATDDIHDASRGHKCFVVSVEDSPGSCHEPKNNDNGTVHVLVIAHPDDESMFFLPTLTSLNQAGETVWLVCLTTGNYNGLGDVRKAELSRVCRLLHISRLIQLQVETLRDHPTQAWDLDAVAGEIERALLWTLRTHNQQQQQQQQHPAAIQKMILITFDFHGVSGHINHRDAYLGVRNLIYQQQQQQQQQQGGRNGKAKQEKGKTLPPLEAWQLETVHFLPFKYLPLGSWLRLVLYMLFLWKPTYVPLPNQKLSLPNVHESETQQHNLDKGHTMVHLFRTVDCVLSWKAMATHQSQWVWYRRLFVIFSCYTFVNKLRPVQ
jgi:N-acetylglucosaminylphosphatidylinositol deacetylase